MKTKVSQIITALLELQGKGYFDMSFNCERNSFQVWIFKRKSGLHERPVYYEGIDLNSEADRLDEVLDMVEALKSVPSKKGNNVMKVAFQCYRREFVKGEKSGKWMKILPVIEYGKNSTYSRLINSSGCYIDDPDNGMQYFVDLKHASETQNMQSNENR